tara:strand:- start:1175 stop:1759 length:585 start_codon:yes stop_codon:yes gene_type:complete
MLAPKRLYYGKDIKNIIFHSNTVVKYFKTSDSYQKTHYFLTLVNNNDIFPYMYSYDGNKKSIIMSNCGDLMSLHNLPTNWREQFNKIRNSFKKYGLCILDVRFLPYTPYVVNNICVKNGKLSIVDVALYRPRSDIYIDYKLGFLEYQLLIYYNLNKIGGKFIFPFLFLIHILCECIRMFLDFLEILILRDVFVF